jgi:hypothetical protein
MQEVVAEVPIVQAEVPIDWENDAKMQGDIPAYVMCDIYKATSPTDRPYIGQAQTHYRNGSQWIKAGYKVRWNCHASEARANGPKQSKKLNNSIRAHGAETFALELLETCLLKDRNEREAYYIKLYDSIENGLNIRSGGNGGIADLEARQAVSNTNVKISDQKRANMFNDRVIKSVRITGRSGNKNIVSATFTLDDDTQKKVDFGGVLQTFADSLKRALRYVMKVKPAHVEVSFQKGLEVLCRDLMQEILDEDEVEELAPIVRAPQQAPPDPGKVKKPTKDAKKLERLRTLNINAISITQSLHKGHVAAMLNIWHSGGKTSVRCASAHESIEVLVRKAYNLAIQVIDPTKITNKSDIQL